MRKMLALYRAPEDVEAFLNHYENIHMPLVRKLPGLLDVRITRLDRTLVGEGAPFLIAEMGFADDAALTAALKSPENAACGADAMAFAGSLVTVTTATALEL
jgi:uncharacterized protein (TIGR02118 family)